MTTVPCLQIDAFAERPFTGNPAAVCLLEQEADAGWMQAVATEMNLSETAFVHPQDGAFGLRWFTPAAEVDLCGHATLAAAHALWSEACVAPGRAIRFQTRSGELECAQRGDAIELDFPATPVESEAQEPQLCDALGVVPEYVGRSRFDALVVIASERQLRALEPDFAELAEIPVRGVMVSSPSEEPRYDFVSRFFAPALGIPEDPVTGSAHCCLGPYWGERTGKGTMTAFQASARGGVVNVRLDGDRVRLGGSAVTVLRGELTRAACDRG